MHCAPRAARGPEVLTVSRYDESQRSMMLPRGLAVTLGDGPVGNSWADCPLPQHGAGAYIYIYTVIHNYIFANIYIIYIIYI